MSVSVRRYSRAHVVAEATIRGRGLFFSRTPDGAWWRLRLRPRACSAPGAGPDEPGPDGGVREPRRPLGPPPRRGAASR